MRWTEKQSETGDVRVVKRFAWLPVEMVALDGVSRLTPTGVVVWLEWYYEDTRWDSLKREWRLFQRSPIGVARRLV